MDEPPIVESSGNFGGSSWEILYKWKFYTWIIFARFDFQRAD